MSPYDPAAPDVALGDLGALLLDGGVPVTDVRRTLERARDATAPGTDLSFAVLPEHVFVSRPGVPGATTIASGGTTELTFRQTAHASLLARRLETGRIALDQVPAHIARIRALHRRAPALQTALGGALLASGLAVLFRCPWWAIALALAVGALVAGIVLATERIRAAAAIVPFVAALISTLIVGLFANAMDLGAVPLFAVCAPVALLVPGALITNALLELTAADIVTGASRLVYGLVMLIFMAAGIYTGALATGLRVDPHSVALVGETSLVTGHLGWEGVPPLSLSWIGVVMLAIGIGLSFGSGFRLTVLTVLVMSCTYAALMLLNPYVGSTLATGIAAGLLFLAARVLERMTIAVPATVSFQPAFLLLVPGTVGLVALTSFDADALTTAPMVFISLCIGVKVGALLADALRITRRMTAPATTRSILIIR
ncbi:MAG: threonine/serine exporter family protein [Actinobacteria bacterium]|nr:threonine/serine exporter family protein [Actinomycetota bacterium]